MAQTVVDTKRFDNSILSKLECDIQQGMELADAVELASCNNLSALIVNPALISQAMALRAARQGRFKLLVPVDWYKGDNYGASKLRGLELDAFEADGFEFLLTGNKSTNEVKTEAKMLSEFVRTHVSAVAEIRFVLGASLRTKEELASMCNALLDVPFPRLVRIDHHIKLPATKATAEAHNALIDFVTKIIQVKLKISGNLNSIRLIAGCRRVDRYGCSLSQAQAIVKEVHQQPGELKDLVQHATEESGVHSS